MYAITYALSSLFKMHNGPGEELDHGSRVYPGAVVVSARTALMGRASRRTTREGHPRPDRLDAKC